MPYDYTGSFSGSFSGDLFATNGIVSSSTQINYNQIQNKPITISAFQKNQIIANSNFRESVFPTVSASFDERINAIELNIPSTEVWKSGSGYIYAESDLQITGSLSATSFTGSIDWNNIQNVSFESGLTHNSGIITLDTSSQHFIDAVIELAGGANIWQQTGSKYTTTNDLEITGSLSISNGLLKVSILDITPTAEAGAIFYSSSNYFFGFE